MATKNIFRATVTIITPGKEVDLGMWDTFTGGDYDSTETKYTPADGEQRVYTGVRTTNNLTMDSDYQPNVHDALLKEVGQEVKANEDLRGQPVRVIVQELGADGNYQANRKPYLGVIKQIVPPDGDSNDAGTIAKIGLVVSVGKPATSGQ
jgi:hypothetical protein